MAGAAQEFAQGLVRCLQGAAGHAVCPVYDGIRLQFGPVFQDFLQCFILLLHADLPSVY